MLHSICMYVDVIVCVFQT